jgi:hypothetical protein
MNNQAEESRKKSVITPGKIIIAIFLGLVISFGLSFFQMPQPVDVHKVEITPVPTPAPIYIQPTIQPTVIPPTIQPTIQPSVTTSQQTMEEGLVEVMVWSTLGALPIVMIFVSLIICSLFIYSNIP